MKESKLQRDCLTWIKKNYSDRLLAINVHGGGYSNKGFPDLVIFGNGKAIVVELKSDSGYTLQPDQIVWKKRFEKVKTPHFLIKDLKSFQETIQKEFDL